MDYHAFAADRKTVDAVLRNITVIGEAARCVPPDIADASHSLEGHARDAECRGSRVLRSE
jgi:uncharacterized protein with HEPN domain